MKPEQAKNLSAAYNNARQKYHIGGNEGYTKKEIVNIFKEVGFPGYSGYLNFYVKHGLLIRKNRGKYDFPEQPIYYAIVGKAVQEIRTQMNSYKASEKSASKVDVTVNVAPATVWASTREEAITKLKAEGIRLLKPRTEYDEL